MELSIFLLMIFIIMILKSQTEILEEDKYYLREDNISLRNDLKRVLLEEETFRNESQKDIENKKRKQKKKKPRKIKKKRNRLYIFEDAKSEEESGKLVSFRNLLKENSISKAILICFEHIYSKVFGDDENPVAEEIILLDNNPDNLPIIFYGGKYEDFLEFIYFCYWEDREDMKWIENPWDMEDLKQALKEIRR